MKTKRLISGIAGLMLATMPFAAAETVVDYFRALPRQIFHEGTPDELVAIMKRGEGESVVDTKNGYLRLEGDGAQVSLQVALFRHADKSPLLLVAWGELEEPDFTHLTVFREKDGKLIVAKRELFPVADSPDRRFELPRIGRTVIVRDAAGAVLSKWTWKDDRFVKE